MNGVAIIYGNRVETMVRRLVEETGCFDRIRPDDSVMIKPNLVASRKDWIGIDTDPRIGPAKSFATGMTSNSRDVGDAGRSANLTAVMTCRVTTISPGGIAHLVGAKKVSVDGRLQEIALAGDIRVEDVDARNQVRSGAIADAVITYKGKKIGPRTGILGSILGILWP